MEDGEKLRLSFYSSDSQSSWWQKVIVYLFAIAAITAGFLFANQKSAFAEPSCSYPNFAGCDLQGRDLSASELQSADFTNANLTGANLKNSNLAYAKFSGASLSNVSFEGANLSYAKLTDLDLRSVVFLNAKLNSTDFSNSNLSGVNLSVTDYVFSTLIGSNLTGANLSGLNLAENNLRGVSIKGSVISGTKLPYTWGLASGEMIGTPASLADSTFIYRGYLMGPGANLDGVDLTGFTLINKDLSAATFNGANLTNTNLSGANLTGALLNQANLSSTNLNTTKLLGISGSGITGTPRNMSREWKILGGFLVGPETNLSGSNLSGLDLRNVTLRGANLNSTNLTNADLRGASLSGAKLQGANLTSANLSGQWLASVNCSDANFTNADLTNSRFERTILTNSNFADAKLSGVKSGGDLTGIPSEMPLGWQMLDGYLVGPGAYLSGANLSQMDFSDISLAGATLIGVNLDAATLGESNLAGIKASGIAGVPASMPSGWSITKGYLVGPTANLDGANFSGVSLATLDLSGATLTNVSSGNIRGVPAALPPEWRIVNGYLVGPGANLADANLADANLSGANLTGANLTGANLADANLSGANLTGANLTSVTLTSANFSSANLTSANLTSANLDFLRSGDLQGEPTTLGTSFKIIGGYLVGPRVDLSNAVLANLDLSSMDLTGTNFGRADLRGANLSASNLWMAVFTSALVEGANFDGAIPLVQATANELKLLLSPEKWSVTSEKISKKVEFKISLDVVPSVGKKVTLTFLAKDTEASYQFQWWREDGTSLSIGSSFYTPTAADLGKKIFCRVTATKANYADTQIDTSLTQVAPGVLTKTVPLISGTARIGGTLSAPSAAWIAGATINYQWFADGKAITSAITPSYKLVASLLNKKITVAVTQSALGYITATATSNAVTVAAGTLTTARPTISGTVKAGNVINAKSTPWITGATLTYQWLLDGKAISGATSASYKVSASQKGKQISVTVTQRATGYATASSTSLSVKVG